MVSEKRYILILLGVLVQMGVAAQTMVYLENAETLSFDQALHPDAQVLRGNVRFRHDDALMYCDSAYFYEKSNSLDAFGHVRFVQGDTLFGYGDKLFYDGNTRMARLRRHVRLEDKSMTLTTDSLNYDRGADRAWYFNGGTLKDSVNTLTSRRGTYISHLKQADFRGDVHLVNDKFVLDSDTLKYNTETHVADILGPTTIVYEEDTKITSTRGWYNTQTEESMLLKRSRIEHVDGNTMTGDTIFYDKQKGFGRAIRNIEVTDSTDHLTLYGNYSEMYEKGKWGNNSGFATDSALLVDWSDSVKYTYIHADTLFTEEIPYRAFNLRERDSILVDSVLTYQAPDTIWKDTTYRQIRAFRRVRTYREDLQSVADSAVYNSRDSLLQLFGKPVAWSDEQQVSAQELYIYMKNNSVDYAYGNGSATAIQKKHRRFYNQLAGKEIYAYVRDGKLRQIDVNGNAETVFFPQDEEDGAFIGVNKTQSSFVKIFVDGKKVERVLFTTSTTGTIYPFSEISDDQMKLNGFFWAEEERPTSPGDVFRHPENVVRPEKKAISAVDNEDKKSKKDEHKNKDKGEKAPKTTRLQ